jgi:branched-chain amino acid transport system substrate-binding protein
MPASDNAFRGYDAVQVLAEGIRRAGTTDGAAVRDAINSINDLQGIAGTFDYSAGTGEGISTMRIYAIKDGAYSELK